MQEYITGTGQRIVNVHERYECQGPWCVIHNPAPGPWSTWPTHWLYVDSDMVNGAMTRICPHRFAHPCAEDNVPQVLIPHHAECDGCPCGPEHIGMRIKQLPPTLQAQSVIAMTNEPVKIAGPVDYAGNPARPKDSLSPQEVFQTDQDSAAVEDALEHLVYIMVTSVVADGGARPARHAVSANWLDVMTKFNDVQVRGLLQFACWYLAESALRRMDSDGTLEDRFGIRLGEDWHDPF
jgi:hypothetical protein